MQLAIDIFVFKLAIFSLHNDLIKEYLNFVVLRRQINNFIWKYHKFYYVTALTSTFCSLGRISGRSDNDSASFRWIEIALSKCTRRKSHFLRSLGAITLFRSVYWFQLIDSKRSYFHLHCFPPISNCVKCLKDFM